MKMRLVTNGDCRGDLRERLLEDESADGKRASGVERTDHSGSACGGCGATRLGGRRGRHSRRD